METPPTTVPAPAAPPVPKLGKRGCIIFLVFSGMLLALGLAFGVATLFLLMERAYCPALILGVVFLLFVRGGAAMVIAANARMAEIRAEAKV